MKEEAWGKIQREMQEKTGALMLYGIELTEIPKELSKMVWLQVLDLRQTQISEIKGLETLTKLEKLFLGKNPIREIKGLEQLINLQVLDLRHTQIREIKGLEALANLRELYLYDTMISEIKGLEALTNLQVLYFGKNQIRKIKGLETLTKLEKLFLGKNPIREIKGLEQLINLQELYLYETIISEIKGLEALANLRELYLYDTMISEIKGLEALTNLQVLYFGKNLIREIKGLEALTKLQELNLNGNKISEVPEQLVLLEHIRDFTITDNPIKTPPYEICLGGVDAIRSWYQSAGKIYQDSEGHWCLVEDQKPVVDMLPLYEVKMVLIGNGNVGKTSLARRLLDRTAPLPTPQERTHGLATYRWGKDVQIPEVSGLRSFRFNIWDFGGQGKFRAVQQLFCSRKSLYLYVTSPDDKAINSREDYRDFGYWLAMIRAYSFDPEESQASPVIHVSNKQDLGAVPINEKDMRDLYPDLHPGTVRTSAQTNEGLDTLEAVIGMVLPKVSFDVFTSSYSRRWLELKQALEERPEAYLSRSEYGHMAQAHGLTDLEAEQWLRVLHRLGTVIYFGTLPELGDTVFLKPDWVREAAYAILRSPAIGDHYGQFRQRDFSQIWPGQTEVEGQKLIALMKAFELCYATQDDYGRNLYIAPALFPALPPENFRFTELSSQHFPVHQLRFQFEPFLPAGLLHRLIVRLHAWLYRSYSWCKGAVLHYYDTYAEITEDWENKQLAVNLKGPAPQKFFIRLRQEVERIVADLKESKMLYHLEFASEGLYKEKWRELDQLEELSIDFWQQRAPATSVRLFISYARADEIFKDELVAHLSGMRHKGIIADWHDRQVLPGQAWDQEIKETLENSQIVLFLISSAFMSSDYIHDVEIARIIEKHDKGKVTIVPVVIRPCDFDSLEISKYQALPLAPGEGLKPVSKWQDRDEAWLTVVNGLKRVIGAQG